MAPDNQRAEFNVPIISAGSSEIALSCGGTTNVSTSLECLRQQASTRINRHWNNSPSHSDYKSNIDATCSSVALGSSDLPVLASIPTSSAQCIDSKDPIPTHSASIHEKSMC